MNNEIEVNISVETNDILLGKKISYELCPIARACQRILPAYQGTIFVDVSLIRFEHKDTHRMYCGYLPLSARNFILSFDAGYDVEPFSFNTTFYLWWEG